MGLYLGEKKVTTNFGRQSGVDSEVIDEKILDALTELDLANITEYADENGNILILPEEEIDLSSKIVGKKNGTAEIFNDYDNNVAEGEYSHAEGYGTIALGKASHAEGAVTYTLTEGVEELNTRTVTINDVSYAISGPFAYGEGSHAEGTVTFAHGNYSHAEGYGAVASGRASHAEGEDTTASGYYSHAEGSYTTASGRVSHAEGASTSKPPSSITSSSSNTDIINK